MKKLKPYLDLIAKGLTHKLFDFKGRASRIEYALVTCALASMKITISGIIFLACIVIYLNGLDEYWTKITLCIISIPLILIFWIAFLSAAIRRLHDLNFRGWWLILIYSNPFALSFSNITVAFILYVIPYLILFFKEGTLRANKFGDVPEI